MPGSHWAPNASGVKVASSRIPRGSHSVDAVALHDAVPATNLLVEAGSDPAGRVDPQVAPELPARGPEPGAEQKLGRAERPAGHDHCLPGADAVGARPAVGPSHAVESGGAIAFEDDPCVRRRPIAPGRQRRPPAADRRRAPPAWRRGGSPTGMSCTGDSRRRCGEVARALAPSASAPSAQELAVAPHALGVHRAHPHDLLRLGVLGRELGGPPDSVLVRASRASTVVRRAEAGARVDHGRAPDGPPDRGRDRRPPFGDREAAIPVERARAPPAAPRDSCELSMYGPPRAPARRGRTRRGSPRTRPLRRPSRR